MMRVCRVGFLAFFVTFLTTASLFAAPPAERDWLRPAAHQTTHDAASAGSSLGKWLAAGLLVALSGVALWKRRRMHRSSPAAATSQIKITGVARLSPRAQLMVATVNGKSMLLGVTDASITRLMWLEPTGDDDAEEPVAPDSISTESEASPSLDLYPNQLERRSRQEAVYRQTATPTHKLPPIQRQTSRFREILSDAIGLATGPKVTSPQSRAPVDELTPLVEDRFVTRDDRKPHRVRQTQRVASPSSLVDVEGQAAGLVARLNRPPS